ncbi:MAG: hypothetical protein EBS23_04150 [Betaproteobacteria bacterium]|nr:hypothetical protein [Betaproteobacteria bacterium]
MQAQTSLQFILDFIPTAATRGGSTDHISVADKRWISQKPCQTLALAFLIASVDLLDTCHPIGLNCQMAIQCIDDGGASAELLDKLRDLFILRIIRKPQDRSMRGQRLTRWPCVVIR